MLVWLKFAYRHKLVENDVLLVTNKTFKYHGLVQWCHWMSMFLIDLCSFVDIAWWLTVAASINNSETEMSH